MQQITQEDFYLKLLVIGVTILAFMLYLIFRGKVGGSRFLRSGQVDEAEFVRDKIITIEELQHGAWLANANKVIAYSSFSLGTVVLAAVFIFEQQLADFDKTYFNIILTIFGASVLFYFTSMQFWFLALDHGGHDQTRLKYRQYATTFQTFGWYAVEIAVMMSVLAVNTSLGIGFCILGVILMMIVYEVKGNISVSDGHQYAEPNEFQKGLGKDIVFKKNAANLSQNPIPKKIRILNWNIERGYDPDKIAAYIKSVNPDFVCLQEVDWNNQRTNNLDLLEILCNRTDMAGYFAIEFYEIDSPLRTKRLAGGGVHGNAILSRFEPTYLERFDLPLCYDWENPPTKTSSQIKREKRMGSRCALIGEWQLSNNQVLRIVSAHLEDKSGGVRCRFGQFKAIVETIKQREQSSDISIVAGDFNTYDSWMAYFYRRTNLEERLGKKWSTKESKWWMENLLPATNYIDPFQSSDWTFKALFFKEKLDWITLKGNFEIAGKGIGNFNTSDHKPLWIDIEI